MEVEEPLSVHGILDPASYCQGGISSQKDWFIVQGNGAIDFLPF
jgi:hypothetical protein